MRIKYLFILLLSCLVVAGCGKAINKADSVNVSEREEVVYQKENIDETTSVISEVSTLPEEIEEILPEDKTPSYEDIWRESQTYPLTMEEIDDLLIGLTDAISISNPPLVMIETFSTEKLAELMMKYPMLWLLTSYSYADMDLFWGLIQSSEIYNELLRREDGKMCLLKEYRAQAFDDAANYGEDFGYQHYGSIHGEVFGCQFILHYWDSLSEEELQLANEIIAEKQEVYKEVKSMFFKQYLDFEGIMK